MKKGKKFKKRRYDPIPTEYINRSGVNHWNWKGKKVSYGALHEWLYKRLGVAKKCEDCGCSKIPFGKKRWFGWANLSREYKRLENDWRQLCIPCHRKFDGWREKIGDGCWRERNRATNGTFV